MRQLPTVIGVRYERARDYEKSMVPDAIWSYTIGSADGDVQGFAGGLLIKTPDGLWQAHYWKSCSGAPAATRERAILNVLPEAAAICDQFIAERAEYDRIYNTRSEHARALATVFPAGTGLVSVHDTTLRPDAVSPEPRYRVTFTFDNLTEEQVLTLAANTRRPYEL
jgi:hypothetical protein